MPIWLIGLGIFFCTGPLWGLLGTVIGMLRTFNDLTVHGSDDPDQLSTGIDIALQMTAIGIFALLVGIVLLAVGIVWLVRNTIKKASNIQPAPACSASSARLNKKTCKLNPSLPSF